MGKRNFNQNFFMIIAVIYTSAVLAWLLATPSLSKNTFFLVYSSQRFALIVVVLMFLLGLIIGFFKTRSKFIDSLFARIVESRSVCLLSFVILIVTIFVILYQVLRMPETLNSLLFRLLPITTLLLCLSTEILVYQHFIGNITLHNSLKSVSISLKWGIEELNIDYTVKIWFWLIAALLILVFVNLFNGAVSQLHLTTTDTWRIGDWLINYQGGFVRRGLLGEVLYQLSRITTINNVILTVVLQLFLYLVFIISVFQLLKSNSFSIEIFMLVFSPGFLLFTVNNPLGSFRKEILWFAFFSILCNYLLSTKKPIPIGFFVGVGISALILVLNHEMLLAFLPYLICAMQIHDRGITTNFRKMIFALIPAGIIAGVVLILAKGSPQIVVDICGSLKEIAPSECLSRGAISSLAQTTQSARAMVISRIDSNTVIVYLITALLGFLPVFLFLFSSKFTNVFNQKIDRVFFQATIIVTLFCSLPLFWVAVDYGRFIYIHIVSLSVLVLMMNQKKGFNEKKISLKQVFLLLFGIAFVILWRLIYAGATVGNVFPWVGLIG